LPGFSQLSCSSLNGGTTKRTGNVSICSLSSTFKPIVLLQKNIDLILYLPIQK
jgi:hypothetical protein